MIENSRKIEKKFKKLKNIIVASFQVKIGLKRLEGETIKIIVPFRSYPTHNRKFQKIKKYHYEFISSQNRLEKDEIERNKNYRSNSLRSVPTRCVIENSKQIAKKF